MVPQLGKKRDKNADVYDLGLPTLFAVLSFGTLIAFDRRLVFPLVGIALSHVLVYLCFGSYLTLVPSAIFICRNEYNRPRPTRWAITLGVTACVTSVGLICVAQYAWTAILATAVCSLYFTEWRLGVNGEDYS